MLRSPPSRRRGLKCQFSWEICRILESPPSRRRGLKSRLSRSTLQPLVASFTEAWIEINPTYPVRKVSSVASFTEAWIEIYQNLQIQSENLSPPSRRRGLKYEIYRRTWISCRCRLLRGGMD